jgi:hypothetical protein
MSLLWPNKAIKVIAPSRQENMRRPVDAKASGNQTMLRTVYLTEPIQNVTEAGNAATQDEEGQKDAVSLQ